MMHKLNGKTFVNSKLYHKYPLPITTFFVVPPNDSPMTTITTKAEEHEHSDSSGFCDSREVSQPTSPTISQPKSQYPSVIGPPASFHKSIEWNIPTQNVRSNTYVACSNFSRSAGSLTSSSPVEYTPTPLMGSYASETIQPTSIYHFWENQRLIIPRISGTRSPKFIDEVVADLLTHAEQDFIAAKCGKYLKCIKYIRNLLTQVDDKVHLLPRTIIFTANKEESNKIGLYLDMNYKIPNYVASENTSNEALQEIFNKCESREIPFLIFQDRIFFQGVNNIDLVINYSLPSQVGQYARRLNCVAHKKCVTFVSSEEDKELVQYLYKIVKSRSRKIPESLASVFVTYNIEQYLREFKVADSWLDLIDEEAADTFICDNKSCFYCHPQYYYDDEDDCY